jgi:hypothetical protein
MDSRKKIDFSKFRCEVYSPDGVFVCIAAFNAKHQFYSPSLVPGQKYYLVFSYDGIFVDCFAYVCPAAGKVVYLSNGHLFFNKSSEEIPQTILEAIAPYMQKAYHYYRKWKIRPRKALDAFIESTHEKAKKKPCSYFPVSYAVGSDLSGTIK